jgi:ATP-binding cassette subfamily B protein
MPQGSSERVYRFLKQSSLIRYYLWRYKGWITIGLFALVLVDLLEVIPPIFLMKVVDITTQKGSPRLLAGMALAYIVISLIQGLCRYAWRMYLIRSSVLAGRDLRNRYAEHLFGLSLSFFDRKRMGDLMSLATNDVESVRMVIGTGILVFADALFYLMTVPVAMFLLSPQLTIYTCLPLLLIPWIVLKNEKKIHSCFQKVQESFGKISAITQENLNGVRVVKAFAREDTQIQRVREAGDEYAQLNLQLSRVQSALGPSMDFVMSLGLVILLFVGGKGAIQSGGVAISLGTFVAFQRYIQKMVWPMSALGMAVSYYQKGMSSSKRLNEIFQTSTDVPDLSHLASPSPRKKQQKIQGRIEFRGLSFQFPSSERPVLKNINLEISSGERVAFVGAIGAGKSALLSLLPRLYPIQSGMLSIDGVDINQWPIDELRHHVGYVGQDVFLFSESILSNVGYGLESWIEVIDPVKQVEEATELASIHEEILRLNSSYSTRLGERGMSLSGGQRQRLTLARALAKQPSVLILDDALSSVDVRTEELILKNLRSRPGRNTELIAAHRISTVQDADRIVMLKDGEIIQIGTHSQLIQKRGGEYWNFYEQQKCREELETYQNELV